MKGQRSPRRLSGWPLLTMTLMGLLAASIYNWWLWRRDRQTIARLAAHTGVPATTDWPDTPRVSALVAAWNENANVERHIESFTRLRYPNKQLVLCAGGSDDTYARATRWAGPDVVILEQASGEGKQRALRRCLAQSNGPIIFLTDADCVLDDQSFERILYPVVAGSEQVCSGGSRPHPTMTKNPFVVSQAASQLYSAMHQPAYAPGLLGRNCVVSRPLMLESGGLDAPALTGTDYVLAKALTQTGIRIRQVPESLVATDYPTSAAQYLRQQRRWLRNVVTHGSRFRASDEVRASFATSLVGLGMLLLPVLSIAVGAAATALWLVLLVHALLSRVRYLFFARAILGIRVTRRQLLATPPLLMLDFVSWAHPLIGYVVRKEEETW